MMSISVRLLFLSLLFISPLAPQLALAGEVEILDARADCEGKRCNISVTLRHADTGWEHYADLWRVLAPDGKELGRRVLYHPHVEEQPFTRSKLMTLPDGVNVVFIEAHDKVHGYSSKRFRLKIR